MSGIGCFDVCRLKNGEVGLEICRGGRYDGHSIRVCHSYCHICYRVVCQNSGICHCDDIAYRVVHDMDVSRE